MPSLGIGEILVLVLIALIVFGPRRLPEIGRTVGRSLREFRRASSEFRSQLDMDLEDEPPRVQAPGARTTPHAGPQAADDAASVQDDAGPAEPPD
ncbi:MAG: twin-arginine translocase TatA/TatE family subunit [Actinomycetota bacterium]|nr:twin-arginine translocase TatA/TatE family subunit [Actinomycetota bacterium]